MYKRKLLAHRSGAALWFSSCYSLAVCKSVEIFIVICQEKQGLHRLSDIKLHCFK